jgi:hypothetical protein
MKKFLVVLFLLSTQCKAQSADMIIIYFSGISDKPILPIIIHEERMDTTFIYKEIQNSLLAQHAINETTIKTDSSFFSAIDRFIQNYTFDKKSDSLDWGNFHIFRYKSEEKINDYFLRNIYSSRKFLSLLINELKTRNDDRSVLLFFYLNNLLDRL